MDMDIPATGITAQGLGKQALQLDCLGLDSSAFHDSLQDLKHICASDLETGIILTLPSPSARPDGKVSDSGQPLQAMLVHKKGSGTVDIVIICNNPKGHVSMCPVFFLQGLCVRDMDAPSTHIMVERPLKRLHAFQLWFLSKSLIVSPHRN